MSGNVSLPIVMARFSQIAQRAIDMGITQEANHSKLTEDVATAYYLFDMDLDAWLDAEDLDFAHDFNGMMNIVELDENETDINGQFIPRFTKKNRCTKEAFDKSILKELQELTDMTDECALSAAKADLMAGELADYFEIPEEEQEEKLCIIATYYPINAVRADITVDYISKTNKRIKEINAKVSQLFERVRQEAN